MKFLNKFFTDNPELKAKLTTKYVDTSIVALNYVAKPLDAFMKHLLVVQKIDPATKPGDSRQKQLNKVFDRKHEKDYDPDFDPSWARKSFNAIKSAMPSLEISEDQYKKVTNLADWSSPAKKEEAFFSEENLQVTKETQLKNFAELIGNIEREKKEELQSLEEHSNYKSPTDLKEILSLIKEHRKVDEQLRQLKSPDLLVDAIGKLVQIAKDVENQPRPAKVKKDPKLAAAEEAFRKGSFRRAPKP